MSTLTVILCVHDGEFHLEQALLSLQAQSMEDWDCIVVDDCSSDGSCGLLTRFAMLDGRFMLCRNDSPLGPAASLNRAISLAEGKYIALMGSGDVWLPERLERQAAYLDANPGLAAVSCKYFTLRDTVCRVGGVGRFGDPDAIAAMLLFFDPILPEGVMARKDKLRTYQYDPMYGAAYDYELWTRMVMAGERLAVMNDYLVLHRTPDRQALLRLRERQRPELRYLLRRYYQHSLFPPGEDELDDLQDCMFLHGTPDMAVFSGLCGRIRMENRGRFPAQVLRRAELEVLQYRRPPLRTRDMLRFDPLFLADSASLQMDAQADFRRAKRAADRMGMPPITSDTRDPRYRYNQ